MVPKGNILKCSGFGKRQNKPKRTGKCSGTNVSQSFGALFSLPFLLCFIAAKETIDNFSNEACRDRFRR